MAAPKAYPPITASGNYVNRSVLVKARIGIKRAVARFLKAQAKHVAREAGKHLGLDKMDDAGRRAKDIADHIVIDWSPLVEQVEPYLASVAVAGGQLSADRLNVDLADDFADGMRVKAADWAGDRAAEMVGMKWEGDMLVPNPNRGGAWQISDTTRDMIRHYVADAIDEGDSTDDLVERLANSYGFSDERAEMIARTEVAKADSEGAILGWKETGIVAGKSWLTAEDDKVSDECMANEAEGVVELGFDYGDGVIAPPQHPNCRCTLLPEMIEELDQQ